MKTIEIKKWLLDKGLKQVDIAKKAHVSATSVNHVIKGKFTSANIVNVLKELGCPVEFLQKAA